MFESLEGNGGRNVVERLLALMLSVFIHGLVLAVLVVLPLVFMRVLPGRDLLTILIVPPAPPVIHVAPAPLSSSGNQGRAAGKNEVRLTDFVVPPAIPQGIPAPDSEPPQVGAYIGVLGSGLGIFGPSGPIGTQIPSGLLAAAPPPVAPAPPRPPRLPAVRVGGDVQEAKLIRKVQPVYPEISWRARVSGEVVMEVSIDEEGNVSAVKVIRGHILLVDEAVRAVSQWKYSPTLLNGEPVPVVSIVTVVFQLR